MEACTRHCGCLVQMVKRANYVYNALCEIQIQFSTNLIKWKWMSKSVIIFVCHRFDVTRRGGDTFDEVNNLRNVDAYSMY